MDLDSVEGLNEIRPSVHRAAMKLLSLQKLCRLDAVSIRHVTAALQPLAGAQEQDGVLSRDSALQTLKRMFHSVSQEAPGHVTSGAPDQTCDLICNLYDRGRTGRVSVACLHAALIALSADSLLAKYRALVCVAVNGSGSVSRTGLRSLLHDLSQVPAAVQEEEVFGDVEAAVRSCFNRVMTPTVGGEVVLSWMQSEPHLLLWLPTLYRLSVSQNVSHAVRCHVCKTFPITGLRYRCMKCVNLHVCQSCFLTDGQTKKHKAHHPVLEYCTQPTWKESLSTLVHSARHALLPRRYARREAERRRGLTCADPAVTRKGTPPRSHPSTRLAASAVGHSPSSSLSPEREREGSPNASLQSPSRLSASKCLQTDDDAQQDSALLTEVRNLHRDKWLMDQQLQAWRLTVQSDQGILEDRCSEMEVTVETLRQHNLRLQGMLTQALKQMEGQPHTNMLTSNHKEPERSTHTSGTEEEERMKKKNTEEEEERMKKNTEEEEETMKKNTEGEEERMKKNTEEEEERMKKNTEEEEERMKKNREEEEERMKKNTDEEEEVILTSSCEEEEEDDEEESPSPLDDEVKEQPDTKTPPPIMHQGTHQSACCDEEEESAGDRCDNHPMTQHEATWQRNSEEAWPRVEHVLYEEEEDCGTCSPEELLQEAAERLKVSMTLRTDSQTGDRMKAELLKAAHTVGDSVHHLVDTVRTHTNHVTL